MICKLKNIALIPKYVYYLKELVKAIVLKLLSQIESPSGSLLACKERCNLAQLVLAREAFTVGGELQYFPDVHARLVA